MNEKSTCLRSYLIYIIHLTYLIHLSIYFVNPSDLSVGLSICLLISLLACLFNCLPTKN
jgi:hypothetical protein